MGIRFNEINPVFGLSQNDTRELARSLCHKRDADERISFGNFSTALCEFDSTINLHDITAALMKAGWITENPDKAGFILTKSALETAWAIKEPRMTFEEARSQLSDLRERLNNAPHDIDGVTVNCVLLFGSTLRDKNEHETVGDLDLIVEMGFDDRYKNMDTNQRTEAAQRLWYLTISQGDERLGFDADMKRNGCVLMAVSQETAEMERPFVLMRIWENENPIQSSLSSEETEAIARLEEKTLRTQNRARIISNMIESGIPVVEKSKPSQSGQSWQLG